MEIIAEIGTAHSGSLQKAYSLIDAASDAGADYIKFQWVYADEILHPETGFVKLPGGNIRLYDRFRELEVEPDFFAKCIDYTHKKGLKFTCSPFGLRSLEELCKLPVDAIKIASPEVNHIPLLNSLAEYYGKIPIIISSGVSKLADLDKAIEIITSKNSTVECQSPLTLLHCITSYPAPEEEYNVRAIQSLSSVFGIPCGISDHSLDPILVPVLSTMLGGTMIEKHITLSKETDGLDDPVALTPEQFATMTHCVHQCQAVLKRFAREKASLTNSTLDVKSESLLESNSSDGGFILNAAQNQVIKQLEEQYPLERILKVLGTGIKRLAPSERANYGRTNRSLHYMASFKKGHKISSQDISVLRTEKILTPGISPEFLDKLLGAKLTRDVENGQGVQIEDFLSI